MTHNDDFLDDIEANNDTSEQETELASRELTDKEALEQTQRNILARKRIDALLEKKRLKELLDDVDDW